MRSKYGLGVLLLAALLGAIAIWFLPVTSAAADILLLITGEAVTHRTTQTEAYEIQTYGKLPTLTSGSLEETTTSNVSDLVTDFEENNLTWSVDQTYSPATQDNDIFSTKSPESPWIIKDLTSDVLTNAENITVTEINNHTRFYPSLYFVDKQSVTPDITTDVMETDRTVCYSGPTNAEVLAIAIGAVFLTILLSALLYQFAVFIRNKKAHRDSSVYIIENELHKYDVEANGLEPETKL
ncbi:uncharacterized protein LOC142744097 [Rhinoderma darwinii]|uniref:uncharacterized protein LOC142744097 n=1 Tax=Rhinoderma darwinii TaxID=43563 RepID=UPI003F680A42